MTLDVKRMIECHLARSPCFMMRFETRPIAATQPRRYAPNAEPAIARSSPRVPRANCYQRVAQYLACHLRESGVRFRFLTALDFLLIERRGRPALCAQRIVGREIVESSRV